MGLNKSQLIGAIASKTGLTKVQASKALNGVVDAITNELAKGGSVRLIGFGTFSVRERSARSGKNPRTGSTIKIPAKKVAKFKPGKQLSEIVSAKQKKGKK